MVERPPASFALCPRPVAELSIEALLGRSAELARSWAIALILMRQAEAIAEVPLEELAHDAPALCAQVLRAVQSDTELKRLTGSGEPAGREQAALARTLGVVSGAHDPVALVHAAEALRGVLWQALLEQVRQPPTRLLGDLGDRLAYVCSAMLAAALPASFATAGERPREELPVPELSQQAARARAVAPTAGAQVVIVDERAPVDTGAAAPAPAESMPSGPAPHYREPVSAVSQAPRVDIEIRDQRREEGPAAWIRSIGAQLQRFQRDGRPFAVLLVELLDLERLRREESPDELARLAARMEEALEGALHLAGTGGAAGSLTRERPGRCWLLAPGTDRSTVRPLTQRLAAAVASSAGPHGAPLAVAIGAAVCPQDGQQASALAAHADVGLYAARARGRAASSAG